MKNKIIPMNPFGGPPPLLVHNLQRSITVHLFEIFAETVIGIVEQIAAQSADFTVHLESFMDGHIRKSGMAFSKTAQNHIRKPAAMPDGPAPKMIESMDPISVETGIAYTGLNTIS